jgi:transketolase
MRNAFAEVVLELAQERLELVLLSGDIGNRVFNPFKESFPNRFYNCGVAEANMTGVAAGMALSGLRPITYTIAPFNTYRCFEQIRVDVCYHNLPVIIVGVGAGLSYASLGATHHSCEDLAILRALPNMTVMAPADRWEVKAAIRCALGHNGPVYVRIGKKNEPVVHSSEPLMVIGKGLTIQEGNEVCLLNSGTTLPVALEAARLCEQEMGMRPKVVSLPTIKPIDDALLGDLFKNFRLVVTVEEHSVIGGMGSAVAEWLRGQTGSRKLISVGTPDEFLSSTGNQNAAREKVGITAERLLETIRTGLERAI